MLIMPKNNWKNEFAEFVHEIMEEFEIPGMSVGLSQNGEVIYSEGFGYADLENEKKVNPETVFGIASITKSFTALAIMILEREGKLTTGDPVLKYLPDFDAGEKITPAINIHHFLTHTAGLPPTPALMYAMVRSIEGDPTAEKLKEDGKWEKWTEEPPIESYKDLLDFWARNKPEPLGYPGGQFSYSNDAYSLLGTIVERISGISLGEFMEEKIFKPCNLEKITFSPDELKKWPNVTQLYAKIDEEIVPAPKWNHSEAMLGAGFLKTHALDLLRYGQSFLGSAYLKRMGSPYFPLPDGKFYGYGFMVQPDYHGNTIIEHGGSLKGISSHLGMVPEENLVATVLINLVEMPVTRVWDALVNLALGYSIEEERFSFSALASLPESSRDWPGKYVSPEGAEIEVTSEEEKLFVELNNKKQELTPVAVDRASLIRRGEKSIIQFLRDGEGKVSGIHMGLRIIKKVN